MRSGMEGLERVELLAGADQLDRLAGDRAHAERGAAAGVAVDPGQHDAGDADPLVEAAREVDRVLAGQRVGDQQRLVRPHRGRAPERARSSARRRCAAGRRYPGSPRRSPGARRSRARAPRSRAAPRRARSAGSRPRPGGRAPRAAPAPPGAARRARRAAPSGARGCAGAAPSLRAGRGLARALQADHQHDPGRRAGQRQIARLAAEQLDQAVVDDLDHHLAGRDAAQHLLADRALADPGDEVLDHRQRDVGLEQRHPNVAQRALDVGTRSARRAASGGRTRCRAGLTNLRTSVSSPSLTERRRCGRGPPQSQADGGACGGFLQLRLRPRSLLLAAPWTSSTFYKMQGLGNDFVVLDRRSGKLSLSPAQIRRIADRRHGVGCDQLIVPRAVGARATCSCGSTTPTAPRSAPAATAPARRAAGHGGARRQPRADRDRGRRADRDRRRPGLHRRHGAGRASAGTRSRWRGRWTRSPLDLARGPLAAPVGGQSRQSARDLLRRRRRGGADSPSSARCWRPIRCSPSAPTSASPRCAVGARSGCGCGSAASA